jgi:hypothetical protein
LEKTVVLERKVLERWGTHHVVSRKGKASPLEAGRGKYSPPVSPERVTSKAGEAKGQGFSLIKNTICHIMNRLWKYTL